MGPRTSRGGCDCAQRAALCRCLVSAPAVSPSDGVRGALASGAMAVRDRPRRRREGGGVRKGATWSTRTRAVTAKQSNSKGNAHQHVRCWRSWTAGAQRGRTVSAGRLRPPHHQTSRRAPRKTPHPPTARRRRTWRHRGTAVPPRTRTGRPDARCPGQRQAALPRTSRIPHRVGAGYAREPCHRTRLHGLHSGWAHTGRHLQPSANRRPQERPPEGPRPAARAVARRHQRGPRGRGQDGRLGWGWRATVARRPLALPDGSSPSHQLPGGVDRSAPWSPAASPARPPPRRLRWRSECGPAGVLSDPVAARAALPDQPPPHGARPTHCGELGHAGAPPPSTQGAMLGPQPSAG